jgi:hypothetical protein
MSKQIILCENCKGEGKVYIGETIDYHKGDYEEWTEECPKCKGSGRLLLDERVYTNVTPYSPVLPVGRIENTERLAYEHIKGDMFKCYCGKMCKLYNGYSISENSHSSFVCHDCFEKWVEINKHKGDGCNKKFVCQCGEWAKTSEAERIGSNPGFSFICKKCHQKYQEELEKEKNGS